MANAYRFLLIGTGPGPKNVLVEDTYGKKQVVTYATWKKIKGVKLSDQYQSVLGFVQQFGEDDEWLREHEVAGQTVRQFTVRSLTSGNLVSIQLWPEYSHVELAPGALVAAEGPLRVNESKGKTYYNLTARRLILVLPEDRVEQADSKPKRTRKAKEAPL